ncbi:hypothetical protein HHI36_016184 [Cryptolaemus montrouzieri]|uniref:Uncharacterized protein n=1 Tax=Cryptolaemus montrouzieri TaxID=559131 RepID=A0ABD2NIY3_9CUCU
MTAKGAGPTMIPLSNWMLKEIGWDKEENDKKEQTSVPRFKPEMIMIDPDLLEGFSQDSTSKSVKKNGSKSNVFDNLHKTQSSTISRRSTSSKSGVKKKTVNHIKSYLSTVRKVELPQSFNDKLGSRKQLFKLPLDQKKANKPTNIVDQSPLIDMEKAEMLLKKKAFNPSNFFNKPTIPKIIVQSPIKEETCSISPSTSGTTVAKEVVKNVSTDSEFEFLERICGVQDTHTNKKIREIRNILKENQEEFDKFKDNHEKRIGRINNLLSEIENSRKMNSEHNKENSFKKIPVHIKTPGSASNRTNDLRMNLLKSNLNKNENGNGNIQKAKNMYSKLRETYSILETPKFNKSRQAGNTEDLSMKVQEQCLMLLETPQRK